MIVTLFGGSRPDEETAKLAFEIGKRVAEKDFILKNGGYTGIMEESARGCVENGGKAIGVCIKSSDVSSLKEPNKYSTEIIYFDDYQGRVKELLKADYIIVLPGQIGTLEEFLVAWIEAITKNLKPVYIMGERNRRLLDFLFENGFVKKDEHEPYIKFVESVDEIDFL